MLGQQHESQHERKEGRAQGGSAGPVKLVIATQVLSDLAPVCTVGRSLPTDGERLGKPMFLNEDTFQAPLDTWDWLEYSVRQV